MICYFDMNGQKQMGEEQYSLKSCGDEQFFYGDGLLEPILKRYRDGHGYDFCLQKLLSLV